MLFWCDAFWPLIGGVEVLAANVVLALRERGHELAVIANREPNLDPRSSFHGVPVHRLPFIDAMTSQRMPEWLAVRGAVASIKREFRPDVVWVFHVEIGVMFHLMTNTAHPAPTVCTVHGTFENNALARETALAAVLRSAAWVAACSTHALEETRRDVPEIASHSSVIWNGLAMPDLPPTPIRSDEPRLLCVGRLGTVEEKGFDLAMQALPDILQRFPHTRLTIAGDGAARPDLERCAQALGVADHVNFLGWVHPRDVLSLIDRSTMLLMPSRVPEGFGLVALQAAQMARPVVATRVGGVAEVVADGETGILVAPEGVAALTDAIMRLLDDPDLMSRMGQAARQRASACFGMERYVDSYETLLRRVAVPASLEASAV